MVVKLLGIGSVLSLICLKTLAYAAYQKKQGNKAGAVGLVILGVLAFAVPLFVAWYRL